MYDATRGVNITREEVNEMMSRIFSPAFTIMPGLEMPSDEDLEEALEEFESMKPDAEMDYSMSVEEAMEHNPALLYDGMDEKVSHLDGLDFIV